MLARLGYEVRRYPEHDPGHRLCVLLAHYNVRTVLDVGANEGQWGQQLRDFGFAGSIFSFEPLHQPFTQLDARAANDPLWTPRRLALGSSIGVQEMNVAGNQGASSSLLPMNDIVTEIAPEAGYVRTEEVDVATLDSVLPDIVAADSTAVLALKLDVQGYEGAVLDGASTLLQDDRLRIVQSELSLEPLYEGAVDWRVMLDRLDQHGFRPVQIDEVFNNAAGEALQVDVTFRR